MCVFLGFSIQLTGLSFLTEEQSEEAEGAIKPTAGAEDDEKDTSERDNNEGKNSNKDSGKMLESFTFPSPTSIPCNLLFLHCPPQSLLKAFIHFKLSEHSHYYSLHVHFACDFYQ